MVGGGVYGINTNGVDSELLEEEDITGTRLGVGKRVTTLLDIRRTARLIVDSLELLFGGNND